MGGGSLDYVYVRLDDPIREIEKRIRDNGKTLQQIWDDMTEEEKKNAIEWGHDWEFPWDEKNVPDSVRILAEDEAWEKCKSVGVGIAAKFKYKTLPTKEARDEWNKIYRDSLKTMIDCHNNGIERETYSQETIETMKKMLDTIKRSKIYLRRIEWMFSGDDGESNLIERTKEDLKEAGLNDECI